MKKLFIATRNPHKLAEIRAIFNMPQLELVGTDDVPGLPEVEEDGETLSANATKKAAKMAAATGMWAMADDSGLEVDALGGAPGVLSARYAGEPADYAANNAKLLGELEGVKDRRARFRCSIALCEPHGNARTVEGHCEGRIVGEPRGRNGFGYDPLFVPDGREQTFAEMTEADKNRISHRANALQHAREAWRDLLATEDAAQRVLVLVNPRSGLPKSFSVLRRALEQHWDVAGIDLFYQFSRSAEDGVSKVRRAVRNRVDTVLVAGGDGTVSTVGRALVGTDAAMGVIPAGSGNGFARHFGIPLTADGAVRALANAEVRTIDVGIVNEMMFLVTCSMAWDASLVRWFERTPIRGVLPYIFAGVHEFFQYEAQDVAIQIDSQPSEVLPAPMVFTIANMTQYGGGARIAPQARPDDGYLELVVALRQDVPKLIANIGRIFDGSINRIPEVMTRQFQSMKVRRDKATPIQIDGELVEAPEEMTVRIRPGALKVLVPRENRIESSKEKVPE